MARQNYNVNTSEKKLEIFGDFSGGMNSQSHPERIGDSQSVLMENVDVVAGGVVQGRGGYQQTNNPSSAISGKTQGRFRYENLAGGQDMVAVNGNLYTVSGNTFTKLTITGLTSFQTTRPIEAVQDRQYMYFATGSGLVKYDGATASLVTPYTPDALEAMYVGLNGLASNPQNYMGDASGAANVILGVVLSTRYGIVNKLVTATAYVQQVSGDTLEYKWEYKNVTSADWKKVNGTDWGTAKSITMRFSKKGDYELRCSLRVKGTTVILSEYVIPRFKVNSTPPTKVEPVLNATDLNKCNRIFIHYDRLFIYGDTGNPDFLYVSQLNNFAYFPTTNVLKITDPLRGSLQTIVRYKNYLVCFTNNSIQVVSGQSPADFSKTPVHTTLGTKYPDSVQIMKNYIAFIGNDGGVYILKSFSYASDEKLNVERIDDEIRDSIVTLVKGASAPIISTVYSNQYYVYIEGSAGNFLYRYYYELGIWVRDSVDIPFATLDTIDSVLYTTHKAGGVMYKLNPLVYKDGVSTPYMMTIKSKDYDFGYPHHRKKIKEYQLLANLTSKSTITVSLYADNNLLVVTPLSFDPTQNSDSQKLKVMASGRFRYVKTVISIPVNELVQLIGFGFVFKENTPK